MDTILTRCIKSLHDRIFGSLESKLFDKLNELKEEIESENPQILEELNYRPPSQRAAELEKDINKILRKYSSKLAGYKDAGKYVQFLGLSRYYGPNLCSTYSEWIIDKQEQKALANRYGLEIERQNLNTGTSMSLKKNGEKILYLTDDESILSLSLSYLKSQELCLEVLQSRGRALRSF